MSSGLAPLSQPVPESTVDPVREYMRKMANGGNDELASQPVPKESADPQRGFLIGGVRL